MSGRNRSWLKAWSDGAMMGMEAQQVIALRMWKAAMGGTAAVAEAEMMVTEKARAAIDAQMLMATSALSGAAHLGPGRAVALYRRRVRANRRRLSKST
ncbi:MAG: hypothetical protein ABI056_08205 [Caulobacteraceae bacterium]